MQDLHSITKLYDCDMEPPMYSFDPSSSLSLDSSSSSTSLELASSDFVLTASSSPRRPSSASSSSLLLSRSSSPLKSTSTSSFSPPPSPTTTLPHSPTFSPSTTTSSSSSTSTTASLPSTSSLSSVGTVTDNTFGTSTTPTTSTSFHYTSSTYYSPNVSTSSSFSLPLLSLSILPSSVSSSSSPSSSSLLHSTFTLNSSSFATLTPTSATRGEKSTRVCLLDLPHEIFSLILQFLSPFPSFTNPHFAFLMQQRQHQLFTFSLVHPKLTLWASPLLYHSPTLKTFKQMHLLVRTLRVQPIYLSFIQQLFLNHLQEQERWHPSWPTLWNVFFHLYQVYPQYTNLKRLHVGFLKKLQFNAMTPTHTTSITSPGLVPIPSSIRHLHLQGTQFSKSLFQFFFQCVPHLQTLSLAWNRTLTDDVIQSLTQSVPQLQWLDVTYCPQLTNVSLRWLAEAYSVHLKGIGVSFCPLLTMDGFLYFMTLCRSLQLCHLITPHQHLIQSHWQRLVLMDQSKFMILNINPPPTPIQHRHQNPNQIENKKERENENEKERKEPPLLQLLSRPWPSRASSLTFVDSALLFQPRLSFN